MEKFRNRGLPSLNEQAKVRHRQITTGRVAVGGLPPKVFLWGMFALIVGGFLYFRSAQSELEEQRRGVMTKQRATAKLLAPKLIPLRDRVEAGAFALAKDGDDFIDTTVDWRQLLSSPSVYLRIRLKDAQSAEALREAATSSLRDGFTSCLMVDAKAQSPVTGKSCKNSDECESGELCNQFEHCQRPSSPFNMRMLYRALSVLSEKWVGEVRDATSEYALTAYDRGLDSITRVDIPMAIDIYQKARYSIAVLDEDPKSGLPAEIPNAFESEPERVQRSAHFARVGVWDLKSGKLLARVRGEAAGELRDVGSRAASGGPESSAARARQANSCALALEFKAKVLPDEFEEPGISAEPAPSAQPAESK